MFERDEGGAGNWGEVTKLTASDAEARDEFGFSVAISGDTVVVGAVFEDSEAGNAGAAYVFGRDQGGAGNWGEVTKLLASDAQGGDFFGASVTVSGDTIVVGRPSFPGAAYIFQSEGDVNCDGNLDAIDAVLILQFSAGLIGSLACQADADVNGDGEVTSVDAALILQFVARL